MYEIIKETNSYQLLVFLRAITCPFLLLYFINTNGNCDKRWVQFLAITTLILFIIAIINDIY